MDVPHRNSFNLLRVLAATLVLFSHSFPMSVGNFRTEPLSVITGGDVELGGVAVAAFFVMSGFLIALSARRVPTVLHYLWARVLRIYPALLVMLLLLTFVLGPLVTTSQNYWHNSIIWQYLSQQMQFDTTLGKLPGVFLDNPMPGVVNGSLWSLKYEFFCYLCLGLLVVLRAVDRKVLLAVTLLLLWQYFYLPQVQASLYLNLMRYFMVGALAALYRESIPWRRDVALLCLFGLLVSIVDQQTLAWLPIFGAYPLLYLAQRPRFAGFAPKIDVSYGLYLYGFPVQQLLLMLEPELPWWGLFLLALPITTMFALASWHLIEHPALRLKDRLPFQRSRPAPISTD